MSPTRPAGRDHRGRRERIRPGRGARSRPGMLPPIRTARDSRGSGTSRRASGSRGGRADRSVGLRRVRRPLQRRRPVTVRRKVVVDARSVVVEEPPQGLRDVAVLAVGQGVVPIDDRHAAAEHHHVVFFGIRHVLPQELIPPGRRSRRPSTARDVSASEGAMAGSTGITRGVSLDTALRSALHPPGQGRIMAAAPARAGACRRG